jgi:hypothetical protein
MTAEPTSSSTEPPLPGHTPSPSNSASPSPGTTVVAVDDDYTVGPAQLTVAAPGVLGNDEVPAGTAAIEVVARPEHGDLSIGPDGSFTYWPRDGYQGEDTFSYRVLSTAGPSDVAVVHLGGVGVTAGPGTTTTDPFDLPGTGADTDPITISGLDLSLGLEWTVSALTLPVPGFLVLLVVILQMFGAAVWLPAVRRSLAGLGVNRPARS